ncbi:hypothetical protein CYMTET_47428 [Cymbomonas tetramitiformis]|uniref:Uncharacterized protein n=1 Tax=Cymbomonas tetramitiformis TaxID=36881 RepID=A0AAE0EXR2_9CHLO|nr:hypothetical protein CYMTET_47428 [Cymbomonas tetramitiformis]
MVADGGEGIGRKYHEYKNCPFDAGWGQMAARRLTACPSTTRTVAPEAMYALALCHIFQVAADAGAGAFAAAVQECGAPAVLAQGEESGGIDVSAYGFSVSDESGVVVGELHGLIVQVVSGAAGGATSAPRVPHGDVGRGEVPDYGMRSRVSAEARGPWRTGHMARISPPTEVSPGRVELVPVAGAFDVPLSPWGTEIGNNINNINSIAIEPPMMCIGQLCLLYPGFDSLSPVLQERLVQVLSSAVTAEPQSFGHDGMCAEAFRYGGVATTAEPYHLWMCTGRRAGARFYFDFGKICNGL